MPLHTEVTEVFTQRRFGAQKLTRRNLYMQKFLHKCTKMFYRRATFTHIFFYTEKPKQLHRAGFTQRRFYTEKLLHRAVFTNRSFHTEKPFHRNKFSQSSFYTLQKRIITSVCHVQPWFRANRLRRTFQNGNFAQVFDIRPASRAKGLHRTFRNRNFNRGFWCLTLIWCTRQKQNSHFTTMSGPPTAPANPNFTTRLGVRRAQSLQMLAQKQVFSHFTTCSVRCAQCPQRVTFRWTSLGWPGRRWKSRRCM